MHFSGRKGKKEQVEQIILKNYDRYYRLAYSCVHNAADAGDVVQNGAYKALRSCHTLKKPEYAQTWVYRIMLNECFQHLRQPEHLSYEAAENGMETGYTYDDYANIDLQRALDSLPDKEKAVVILKYFEDRTLEEIADILDENINTVKSRLYRSIRKLRGALSDEVNGNEKDG